MDPLVFILAPSSMMDAEYNQWKLGIPFTDRVIDKLDYNEFSEGSPHAFPHRSSMCFHSAHFLQTVIICILVH